MSELAQTYIRMKPGDSLILDCIYADDGGAGISLQGATVTTEVRRKSGALVAAGSITLLDQGDYPGEYVVTYQDTAGWPVEVLDMDVRYVLPDGTADTTATIKLRIGKQVTR